MRNTHTPDLPEFAVGTIVRVASPESPFDGYSGRITRISMHEGEGLEWRFKVKILASDNGTQYTPESGTKGYATFTRQELTHTDPLIEINFGFLPAWQAWILAANLTKSSSPEIVLTGMAIMGRIKSATTSHKKFEERRVSMIKHQDMCQFTLSELIRVDALPSTDAQLEGAKSPSAWLFAGNYSGDGAQNLGKVTDVKLTLGAATLV